MNEAEVVDLLVRIGRHDERLLVLEEAIGRSLRKLKRADQAAAKAQQALDDHTAAQTAARKQRGLWQDELRRFESQKDKGRRMLESGLGSADAAERQIATCEERIDDLETKILESMMEAEEGEETTAQLTEAADAAAEHAADVRNHARAEVTGWREEVAHHKALQEPLVAQLPRGERRQYDALVAKGKTAIASIDGDQACRACHTVVPHQRRVEVKDGRLATCSGCGRWLTYADLDVLDAADAPT